MLQTAADVRNLQQLFKEAFHVVLPTYFSSYPAVQFRACFLKIVAECSAWLLLQSVVLPLALPR